MRARSSRAPSWRTSSRAWTGLRPVTYDGDPEHTGIVPTINIYVSPQLKERVRAYEERWHPRYLEVLRSNGLIFRPFGKN